MGTMTEHGRKVTTLADKGELAPTVIHTVSCVVSEGSDVRIDERMQPQTRGAEAAETAASEVHARHIRLCTF